MNGGYGMFTYPSPVWVEQTNQQDIGVSGQSDCWVNAAGNASCDYGSNLTLAPAAQPGAVTRIFAGYDSACALGPDGLPQCWGEDEWAQFGYLPSGATLGTVSSASLVTSAAPVHGVTQAVKSMALSVGGGAFEHACALLADGTVACAGANNAGQLGDGTNEAHPFTSSTAFGVNNVVEIAAGNQHTCARTTQGAVYCWGLNSSGQIGDGTTFNRFVPALVTW
jgi:alpha-tubulin suppressor-like RCC1 family protein